TDLYVRFPDATQPGGNVPVVEMSHMTLVVELRDSMTNTALARVADLMEESSEDRIEGGGGDASRAAAERSLTKWAVALRPALDRAHAAPPADGKTAPSKN